MFAYILCESKSYPTSGRTYQSTDFTARYRLPERAASDPYPSHIRDMLESDPSSLFLTALPPPPAGARRTGVAAVRPAGASPPCRRPTGCINIYLYTWMYRRLPSLQATRRLYKHILVYMDV